jgi:Raf kinase inhibitor-like YbhB/YbcL family protein
MATDTMLLRAATFDDGQRMPRKHSADGNDEAVELTWSGAPAGTRSFVLLVEDPDAPAGTFVHWVRYDVPAAVQQLSTNQSGVGVEGLNDYDTTAWRGPNPPRGDGEHRYVFRVLAVDVPTLGLQPGARATDVHRTVQGHVLARGQLVGHFGSAPIPAGQADPRMRRIFWGALLVFAIGAVALVVLGLAGIFLAPLLGGIAVVALLIWGWRRMAERKPPLRSANDTR